MKFLIKNLLVNLFFKNLLFSLVFFLFTTSCSQKTSDFVSLSSNPLDEKMDLSDYEGYRLSLSLPIDENSNPRIYFVFESPEGFHTPIAYIEAFLSGRSTILEYIPKGETLDRWSEIITVNLLKGRGIQAKLFTDALIESMAPKTKDYRVFQLEVIKEGSVETSEVAIMYKLPNKTVEIAYMKYHSGPYDCSGIQYSVKIDKWLGDFEFQKVAKEIQVYVSEIAYPVRDRGIILSKK
jgi:hypothetical protein